MPVRGRYNVNAVSAYVSGYKGLPKVSRDDIEVRFVADIRMDDGRYLNNGWLQECPDPITKISWDNAIQVSPRLAKELGIDSPERSASGRLPARTWPSSTRAWRTPT